jgi:hypothetical protein
MTRFCCPNCKAALEHSSPGTTVGCPTCGQTLEVPAAPGEELPPVVLLPEARPRPRYRKGRWCPECGASVRLGDRSCPECAARLPRRRYDLEPHRGTVILVLGILSLVIAHFILGPIAWYMATEDLKKIRAGRMDPEGESPTNTGRICGMIGTILGIVGLVFACIVMIVWLGLVSVFLQQGPHR